MNEDKYCVEQLNNFKFYLKISTIQSKPHVLNVKPDSIYILFQNLFDFLFEPILTMIKYSHIRTTVFHSRKHISRL